MGGNINQIPCLYFSANDSGVILYVNSKLCHALGYEISELVGRNIDLIFTIATRIFQQTHFFPLLRLQGFAEEVFVTLQTKDGAQVPVLLNANRDESGDFPVNHYAGMIVHNRKKFEDELVAARHSAESALRENTILNDIKKELQESLEMLDRQLTIVKAQNEELRQFNHVVTHDLQEPLRKLFLVTSMMLPDDGERSLHHQKIKAVASQIKSIVSGLQQYIWLTETPLQKEKVDLEGMIRDKVEKAQQENPDLTIQLTTDKLLEVEADPNQLGFLFGQLIDNAIRFRKTGNAIDLEVHGNTLMRNRFRQITGKYKYEEFFKLEFTDRGIGFDATYKDQAFNLFRKFHTNSGRGIGLSLCRKIAENHDGQIYLETEKDAFTRIVLILPVKDSVDIQPGTQVVSRKTIE